MTFFDHNLNSHSSVDLVAASIQARLDTQDAGLQMMAMSDLCSVVTRSYGAAPSPALKSLVARAASALTEAPNRGVAGHAVSVFTSSSEAARDFLPQLLQFLEHGFPGRDEPGMRVTAMRAVGGAGVVNANVERVLKLYASRDPATHKDDVFFAKEALGQLGIGYAG